MHIPDGYLGPQTYIAAYAAAVPFWVVASRKLTKTLRHRQVPLLALGAAFSFLIMMFNVPIPGGTTGHAVGGGLLKSTTVLQRDYEKKLKWLDAAI